VVVLLLFVGGALPWGVARVSEDSMAPTLTDGDQVLLDHTARPARGDVVVLTAPDGTGTVLKRVAAVGGNRVGIDDGTLVVNGTPVVEPYFDRSRIDGEYFGPVTVPAGTFWVLGDNRGESVDSRSFGPVPAGSLIGRVTVRLLPAPRAF
jgi:signal peptidase I